MSSLKLGKPISNGFNVIMATNKKGGIGFKNNLPWNFKSDMNFFKHITGSNNSSFDYILDESKKEKNAIIMGKNTWNSLPKKPLPNRHNIIVSTSLNESGKNYQTVNNFEEALKVCYGMKADSKINDIYVIGGKGLVKEALGHPDLYKLYHTSIDLDAECDVFVEELQDHVMCSKVEDGIYQILNTKKINDVDRMTDKSNSLRFSEYLNMNRQENAYLDLLHKVMNKGEYRKTRNSYVKSIFGETIKFNLRNNDFPLVTTRKAFLRGVFEELDFFFNGETDSKILEEKKVNIWKGNTSREFLDSRGLNHYKEGLMGPMYGFQWRYFNARYDYKTGKPMSMVGFDQIEYILNEIITNSNSRRLLMTTFNPDPEITKGSVLYPCHGIKSQFYVTEKNIDTKYVSMIYDIRSSDLFLGLVFNIASSALMLKMFCANLTKRDSTYSYEPNQLIINIGDAHIYEDHFSAVEKQLERIPRKFPKLIIKENKELEDYNYEDLKLIDYTPHPGIKAPMNA